MIDHGTGTAQEIDQLTATKRALEASSRAIHKAWRAAQSRGLSPRKMRRIDALKAEVYQQLEDVDLLLRLLTQEE